MIWRHYSFALTPPLIGVIGAAGIQVQDRSPIFRLTRSEKALVLPSHSLTVTQSPAASRKPCLFILPSPLPGQAPPHIPTSCGSKQVSTPTPSPARRPPAPAASASSPVTHSSSSPVRGERRSHWVLRAGRPRHDRPLEDCSYAPWSHGRMAGGGL